MKHFCLSVLLSTCSAALAAPAVELPSAVVQAFDAYTALPSKLAPLLEKAQDTASATSVARELQQALTTVYKTRELLHNLPRLTPTQNQHIRTQYGLRMREEWARMYTQISRLKKERCYQSAEFAEAFHLMCMMIER